MSIYQSLQCKSIVCSFISCSLYFSILASYANTHRSGTAHHLVKVFNFTGQLLSSIEPHHSFLNTSRQNAISATAFHPHRMMLAAASRGDNHVNFYTCDARGGAVAGISTAGIYHGAAHAGSVRSGKGRLRDD